MAVNKHNKISILPNSEASELKHAELPSYTAELGSFPDRLQKAVGDKSVRSFAAECGMSDTVVRQYLSGKSEPTRPAIIAIARVAGCSIEWLLTGEGPMKRGESVEAGFEESKGVMDTKIADRSPIKQAAVSYIDAMTDVEAAEVIKFLVPQQKTMGADEAQFRKTVENLSLEAREKLRVILDEKSKERPGSYDALNYQEVLRPTGT